MKVGNLIFISKEQSIEGVSWGILPNYYKSECEQQDAQYDSNWNIIIKSYFECKFTCIMNMYCIDSLIWGLRS